MPVRDLSWRWHAQQAGDVPRIRDMNLENIQAVGVLPDSAK